MYVEEKYVGQDVGGLSEEAIVLLRKLIMMLAPASITTSFGVRVDTTGSPLMDGIGTITAVGGTIPTVTSINQLGGCGIGLISSAISLINTTPIYGGWNYTIGDIVTLSGGVGGSVMVTGVDEIGSVQTLSLYTSGTGYTIGNSIQVGNTVRLPDTVVGMSDGSVQMVSTVASSNGMGLIVNILSVDGGYGNANFLQTDLSRWLYSDMIQDKIN